MQQHSGQHLISAVLDMREIPTLAWALGETVSYVELPRKLTDAEIVEVEDQCNEYIRQGLDITVEVPNKEDVNTTKLPDDYDTERGILRVVHIGNLDNNPCCGTHLSNTREMNSIVLLHQQAIRGTNSRLHFLIGDRVRRFAREANAQMRATASHLSCMPDEIGARVEALEKKLRAATKSEKALVEDMAAADAEAADAELAAAGKAYIYRRRGGFEYFNAVQRKLSPFKGFLVLASGTPGAPGELMVLANESATPTTEVADKIKAVVSGVQGGAGTPKRWQGKVPEWHESQIDELAALMKAL
ncbi:Threonyl/alanyl tRNA synthetase [Dipodascopsis tothii]|uniref:Threonyl/alanyl tRNA synthetase n=1 Tax=Dipodascopsis tothii TaxID=44089 RepID=UPI0034CF4BB3